jgi:putative ABC transport system permease protein
MTGYSFTSVFLPDRDSLPSLGEEHYPSMINVSADYFRASGVRLVAGRVFDDADRPDGTRAVVVSQSMARVYWPGQSALGKCLIVGDRGDPCSLVVGVVADVHRMAVVEKPTMQFYLPVKRGAGGNRVGGARYLIIRTSERDMPAVSRIASQELKRAFPRMSAPRIASMASMLEPEFRPWKLGATLFTAFGVLAALVAAIGVYSVVAYAVSQRTQEMGIRIALGARLTDVVSLVLVESSRIVTIGVVLGIAAAIGLGRLVASLLYGISPRDPLVIACAACALLGIGLPASIVPGLRAARVDPSAALRAE